MRPAGVREEVCDALEAALRLALRARRRGSQPAPDEVGEAPSPRSARGDDPPPSSIDVEYEDEGTVYFRRIVGPTA